jgi:hypothetical protein
LVLFAHTAARGASICATVGDSEGDGLPQATVNVVSLTGEKRYSARTDATGRACFASTPEGLYSVEAGLIGFLNVRYYPVRVSYPEATDLSFRLPLGEVNGDSFEQDAVMSGTLLEGDRPVGSAKVCMFEPGKTEPYICGKTTDLGEYALTVPTGTYVAVITRWKGEPIRETVEPPQTVKLPTPGRYRNLLAVPTR